MYFLVNDKRKEYCAQLNLLFESYYKFQTIHKRERNTILDTSFFYPVNGKLLVGKYISNAVLQISFLGPLLQKIFENT